MTADDLVERGKMFLSCGCEYRGDLDKALNAIHRTWTEEVCTRNPENPFVLAEVSGHYCDECWRKMLNV
jgi:hypothetical protein